MAMHAPLAAVGPLDFSEGGGEVEVAHQRTIGAALDHLVQIDTLVEALELRQGFAINPWHPQGGRELQLENANAGAPETRDAAGRVLEFDGCVTDIVADADVPPKRGLGIGGRVAREARKPSHRLAGKNLLFEKRYQFV